MEYLYLFLPIFLKAVGEGKEMKTDPGKNKIKGTNPQNNAASGFQVLGNNMSAEFEIQAILEVNIKKMLCLWECRLV